ncbi:MAG: hypothetical protein KA004_11805 [Verrucomicrobiales bacterium]|nr:hypothetical protein [Verrucomicrobiales bacterium]
MMPHAAYEVLKVIHLFCAITFVGAVFFEVLVIEPLEKRLPRDLSELLAKEIPRRVRCFMPYVVGLLFVTGIGMFVHWFKAYGDFFFHSRFGILLTIKASLAIVVLGIFANAIYASFKGKMDLCRFRYTHRIVAGFMVGIVLLAKALFWYF